MSRWGWVICAASILLAGCEGTIGIPTPIPNQVTDQAPSWSGDGRSIAYIHWNPELADTVAPTGVYVTDLSGTTRCVVASLSARSVDWSPDGRWLVFDDGRGLNLVRASGDSLHTIYAGGLFPAWSPSGDEIAFSTTYATFAIRPDGSGLRRLTADSVYVGDSDWSPDGQRLVGTGVAPGITTQGGEVIVFAPAERAIERLTFDGHEDRAPVWSPQGDRIAWEALPIDAQGQGHLEVRIMGAHGGASRLVLAGATEPSWDPTGTRLVLCAGTLTGDRLFVIGADGTGLRQVTR